jgi:putative oxidoreductase
MKYGTIARCLIALLFVVAGVQKLMSFSSTAGYVGSLGVPMATLATAIVIVIEVLVALAFAFGYKVREMGYILIGYVVVVTLVAHHDFSQGANMIMALKNIAIIGGLMLAVCCKERHHG